MKKFVLERRSKPNDNIFFVFEEGRVEEGVEQLYGVVEVERENKSPYVFWKFLSEEISFDEKDRLQREAINIYFRGIRGY